MNFEKFTSLQKHPPAPEVAPSFEVAANEELIGHDKVLKVLLNKCPKSAKVYLKDLV